MLFTPNIVCNIFGVLGTPNQKSLYHEYNYMTQLILGFFLFQCVHIATPSAHSIGVLCTLYFLQCQTCAGKTMLIPITNSLTNPACFSDTVIQKKKQEDGECLFLGKKFLWCLALLWHKNLTLTEVKGAGQG